MAIPLLCKRKRPWHCSWTLKSIALIALLYLTLRITLQNFDMSDVSQSLENDAFDERHRITSTIGLSTKLMTNGQTSTQRIVPKKPGPTLKTWRMHFIKETSGKRTHLRDKKTTEQMGNFTADYQKYCEGNFLPSSQSKQKLCDCVPSDIGGTTVNLEVPDKTWLEGTLGKSVKDGHWEPPECQARQNVVIIVPFRQREQQLLVLLQHLHPFLQAQLLNYTVVVVEQFAPDSFNKAAIMNVGYVEVIKLLGEVDCVIFHDVDMLADDLRNFYTCHLGSVHHLVLALDKWLYRPPHPMIVGGALAFEPKLFEKINGFSNSYWGWGGEDDDMYHRITTRGVKIHRYPYYVGSYVSFLHMRDRLNPTNPRGGTGLQKHPVEEYDKDGLNSIEYRYANITKQPLYVHLAVVLDAPSLKYKSQQGYCPGSDKLEGQKTTLEECATRCDQYKYQSFQYDFSRSWCILAWNSCDKLVMRSNTKYYVRKKK